MPSRSATYDIRPQDLNVMDAFNDLARCDGHKLITGYGMMIHDDRVGIQSKSSGDTGCHHRHYKDCPRCKTGTIISEVCIDCKYELPMTAAEKEVARKTPA